MGGRKPQRLAGHAERVRALVAAEHNRDDIALARTTWLARQAQLNPERLVFMAET